MARRLQPLFVMQRHDRPGHIDPAHAERLLEWSRTRHEQADDDALLHANAEDNDLARQLGQTTVTSMTSGDAEPTDDLEARVNEEIVGLFVVPSTKDELDEDIDLSELDQPRPAELADDAEFSEPDDEPQPSGPRSWGTIYLPRAKELAGWLGRHMRSRAVALGGSVRPKAK